MNIRANQFSRRKAIKLGAGLAGTVAALSAGVVPALADDSSTPIATARLDEREMNAVWDEVNSVLQTPGEVKPGNVLKVAIPRTDLKVSVAGLQLNPAMVHHELSFLQLGTDDAVMKFESVMLDAEVNAVVTALLQQGLYPSALHNHMVGENPPLKYMHSTVRGKAGDLARAFRAAFSNTATPFGQPVNKDGPNSFSADRVAAILGGDKDTMGGVLEVAVERQESFKEMGLDMPPTMQLTSMFVFQDLGNGQAAASGEFLVLPNEVQTVSNLARQSGFQITAVHNHELTVQPMIFWLHFMGTGPAEAVAQGIRTTLNSTNSKFK